MKYHITHNYSLIRLFSIHIFPCAWRREKQSTPDPPCRFQTLGYTLFYVVFIGIIYFSRAPQLAATQLFLWIPLVSRPRARLKISWEQFRCTCKGALPHAHFSFLSEPPGRASQATSAWELATSTSPRPDRSVEGFALRVASRAHLAAQTISDEAELASCTTWNAQDSC